MGIIVWSQYDIMKTDGKEFDTKPGGTVWAILPASDEKGHIVKLTKNNQEYETNYARFKPFLLSKGRHMIGKIIEPHLQYIKHVHTDGCISTKDLTKDLEKFIGNDIGELKYEGFCKTTIIKNCNSVVGTFIV